MSSQSKRLRNRDALVGEPERLDFAPATVLNAKPAYLIREFEGIARIAFFNKTKGDFHGRISRRHVHAVSTEAAYMEPESVGPSNVHFFNAIKDKYAALREQSRLMDEALKDGLTGAFNRRFFDIEIEKIHAMAARRGTGYAVVMIDGDKFKNINDTYGHQAGDAVLKEVVARLQKQAREEDHVCRYGGEEFAVILPDCGSIASAAIAGERMRQVIEGKPFTLPDGRQINFTASFGVSVNKNPHKCTAHAAIEKADMALYVAKGKDIAGFVLSDDDKASARNRVAYFNSRGDVIILNPRDKQGPGLPFVLKPVGPGASGAQLG